MHDNAPIIALPFEGQWASINSPGHHRYAYDFVVSDSLGKKSFSQSSVFENILRKVSVERWLSWSEPVLSPCDGVVIEASDGRKDRADVNFIRDIASMVFSRPKIVENDVSPFAGNYVLIQADTFVAFLAHLKCGSVAAKKGQKICRGDVIGKVGNSGYSLAPHIHFQLMASRELLNPEIIPFRVNQFTQWNGEKWVLKKDAVVDKNVTVKTINEQEIRR